MRTLGDKVWDAHVVRTGPPDLLYVDLHLVNEVASPQAFSARAAGANFGTGSSREHAVWALVECGFQAVISPRFGGIFRDNAARNGLVPIDVAGGRLVGGGVEVGFSLDPGARRRLVDGLDDVDVTLAEVDAITAFEARRPAWMPLTRG